MCRHEVFPFAKILHRIDIFEHFEGAHPMIIPVKFGKFTHIVLSKLLTGGQASCPTNFKGYDLRWR